MQNAFWVSGGAGGVQQQADAVGVGRWQTTYSRNGLRCCRLRQFVQRGADRCVDGASFDGDDELQIRKIGHQIPVHCPEIEPTVRSGDEHHLCASLPEDESEFPGSVDGNDRVGDRAELHDGLKRDDRLGAIGQLERHDVAGSHTATSQCCREPCRRVVELAEGDATRTVDHRNSVWVSSAGTLEEVGDGLIAPVPGIPIALRQSSIRWPCGIHDHLLAPVSTFLTRTTVSNPANYVQTWRTSHCP